MAAESDTVGADTINGRYKAAAVAAAAAISLSPRLRSPLDLQPFLLPPTPPLVTTLPPAISCSYIGEGSANAVFCVTPKKKNLSKSSSKSSAPGSHNIPSNDSDAGSLSTHLLRIPKAGPGVGAGTCLDHHAYYSSVLRPLIGTEWLVGQHLVQGIISRGVQSTLNDLLENLDRSGRRRPDWVGTRISPDVDVALLVEDMTLACNKSLHPSTTTTVQFKPKWLVQSPSAPAGARRCRTCALSAASASPSTSSSTKGNGRKNSNGPKTTQGRSSSGPEKSHKIKPCPIVLVADPPKTAAEEADLDAALWEYVYQHLGSAVSSQSSSPNSSTPLSPSTTFLLLKTRPAIIRWMRTTNLFRRIAAIQAEHDPHGALAVDLADDVTSLDRLQTAMTLRDCTCFLRVTVSESSSEVSISAKLGDLDRKDGRRKLARWQAQERALLDGGFYLCTEEPRQQTNCWFERRRGH
ncbi:inositol-pentakisphosphate 2-kinase [Ophiostoma piceae UAMH 11346]|uniref:Inositol-pentakisphosphate 2-kinase n=1 Tax=Ophiostoma piceae (strain UAMH 11346) TaxID=1262450 RepID=S3CDC2_OPHP1|nr:inositol-pentakisphosphate 2-kinase [Ophiostoma piceae UAMH 11346]